MEDDIIFSLRGVGKRFGAFSALLDLDLTIRAGEQVALVGPSGAGKSTIIGLLNGSIEPTSGELRVFGQDLWRLGTRKRRAVQMQIGTIYQQFHLTDSLRVVHNVNAGHLGSWSLLTALVSLAWPLDTGAAARALAQVGIPEKLYERTDRLSGGQQQRVALARVLVQDPRVVLADEPVASLDPERGREIMDLLRDLSRQSGKTLVASVHAFHFARTHFDRVIGLREGRIFFDVPPEKVTHEMVNALYHTGTERVAGTEGDVEAYINPPQPVLTPSQHDTPTR